MFEQSRFSRLLASEAKMGAYYTDLDHASRLGALFSAEDDVSVLEPSCGDGSALNAFCGRIKTDKKLVKFGVELNAKTYDELMKTGAVDYVLHADFLTGTIISNKVFSLCFSNPPYGATGDDGKERLENKFVERIFTLLKPGAYLVLVVNTSTICSERFARCLLGRFELCDLYRFDDKEYAKFKQVAFIGRRRSGIGIFKDELEGFLSGLDVENLPQIPTDGEPVYRVPGSPDKTIELFTGKEYDPSGACLSQALLDNAGQFLLPEAYRAVAIGRPPLPLKKDLLYLCAVAGGGQGLAGSEENYDLHLQRGVAKRVESVSYLEDTNEEVVTTSTKISLNTIDNYGNISTFE